MATGYRDSYTYHKASDFDRFAPDTSRVSANIPQLTRKKDEIRILLIGKTGAGKSMTGNTILGREVFKVKASSQSVTQRLQYDDVTIEGKRLLVVDTPGYFDTQLSEDALKKEIKNCVGITSPGLHAFILVTEIARMTKESLDVISKCREQFGDHMENYLIVLFTKTDFLEQQGTTIEDFLAELDEKNDFKKLLRKVHNRYIAFNNIASQEEKQAQVKALKNKIERLIDENNGMIFTNQMYKDAEKEFQQKVKMELQRKELQEKREFEKRIEPYVQKIKKMEEDMKKKNNEVQKIRDELERATAKKIKDLEDSHQAQLKEERDKINDNTNKITDQMKSLRKSFLEKRDENESLKDQINDLNEKLSNVMSTMKSMEEQKSENERRIQQEMEKKDREKEREKEEIRQQHRRALEKKSGVCPIL